MVNFLKVHLFLDNINGFGLPRRQVTHSDWSLLDKCFFFFLFFVFEYISSLMCFLTCFSNSLKCFFFFFFFFFCLFQRIYLLNFFNLCCFCFPICTFLFDEELLFLFNSFLSTQEFLFIHTMCFFFCSFYLFSLSLSLSFSFSFSFSLFAFGVEAKKKI